MDHSSHPIWCWALGPAYIRYSANRAGLPVSAYNSAAELMDYFHCCKLAYFPGEGEYTADTFAPLAGYDQVMTEIYHMSEAGRMRASELSRLSLQFPNLVSGIIDDFSSAVVRGEGAPQENQLETSNDGVSQDKQQEMVQALRQLAENLKSANPALRLHGVCYTMHMGVDLSPYLPYIDEISLWVWQTADLVNLDAYVVEANRLYQKPLHLGLYLFDWGAIDYSRLAEYDWVETVKALTLPMETLQYQCERARQYLRDGRIEAIHILGDYHQFQLETEQARWLADFCRSL